MNFIESHPQILMLPLFLFLSAFFSGSETALFSLNKTELFRMSNGTKKEMRISRLMTSPQKILITLILSNLFINTMISIITTETLMSFSPKYAQFITIAIATPLIILFGEITPKILAIVVNVRFSIFVINIIYVLHKLLAPARVIILLIINVMIKFFRLEFKESTHVTEGEIDAAIEMSRSSGTLAPEESRFIRNILKFSKKTAQSIMIPRNKIIALEYGSKISDAMNVFIDNPIVRVPVYTDDLDNIVGVLDSRTLLSYHHGYKKASTINSKMLTSANHFPYSKDLSSLLSDFLEKKLQLAVVVDEYGGTMGIVTLSGIISEVMGENFTLSAEHQKRDIRQTEDALVISGDMLIVDFNEEFNESIKSSESETMAGYIIEALGRIPVKGNFVETQSKTLKVRKVIRNRIESIEIIDKEEE